MNVEARFFLDLAVVCVTAAALGVLPAVCLAAGIFIGRRWK